eukprot:TRINITY_DN421_c0_g1_i1.p1 TRINITY_DN421_c0_g1~~TRINITY_DN421_c0_g1_i1.p1  ORF type:complete len:480 (-),score=66.72 TRINITY_DN421_c0_g1_i1:26-1390(-)
MKGRYPVGGPKIVRQELERLGFVYVPKTIPNNQVDVIWTMRLETHEIQALLPHQKSNFLPGMPELCIKHLLHKNIQLSKKLKGEKHYDFWPNGFWLPEEFEEFTRFYKNRGDERIPFIIKPSRCARGDGIICITHVSEIEKNSEYIQKQTPVAQEYIMNPLLLDGYKITFRIYVAVTSFDPLRIYIYPKGLTRICSERYTVELDSFKNSYIHLTNYDINKFNESSFVDNVSKEIDHDGLRCDVAYIFNRLRDQGIDVNPIWEQIKYIATATFLSAEKKLSWTAALRVPLRHNCFELLGFDILVDENMKAWLLEVNHAPNLEPHTQLETEVKRSMLRDLMQLVDMEQKDVPLVYKMTDEAWTFVESLQNQEIEKEAPSEDKETQFLKTLDTVDIWTIIDTELEFLRRGAWQRLFPNPDSNKYAHLFTMDSNRNETIIDYFSLGKNFEKLFGQQRG